MVNSVKLGTQIEKNERAHIAGVYAAYKLVMYGDDGGFSRVTISIRRLTAGQQTLGLNMCTESGGGGALDDLG